MFGSENKSLSKKKRIKHKIEKEKRFMLTLNCSDSIHKVKIDQLKANVKWYSCCL